METKSTVLGQRIKYFRKRSGLSQLELEAAIATSAGSLSRIENGDVNPTKETLEKIGQALNLTLKQIVYLNGLLADCATEQEVALAINKVSEYFHRKGVLSYMIDDRWRLLYASGSFINLLGFTQAEVNKILGKTLVEVMVDETLGAMKFLEGENYEKLLEDELSRFYFEVGFMGDDPIFQKSLKSIESNQIAKKVWNIVIDKKDPPLHHIGTSSVKLKVNGLNLHFYVIREFIHKYPRFEIIEFIPANPVIKLLSRL